MEGPPKIEGAFRRGRLIALRLVLPHDLSAHRNSGDRELPAAAEVGLHENPNRVGFPTDLDDSR